MVGIEFLDEVYALLLSSPFSDSWFGTITTISSSVGCAKLAFEDIHDLILSEDVCRRSVEEAFNSLLSTKDIRGGSNKWDEGRGRSKSRKRGRCNNIRDITSWNYKDSGHFRN